MLLKPFRPLLGPNSARAMRLSACLLAVVVTCIPARAWPGAFQPGAGIFGTATGALTLAFAEVARRGGGAVTAGVGDPAALPPA